MIAWFASAAWALTCDQIFDKIGAGTPEAEIVEYIRLGPDMTVADLKCLSAGSAPRAIVAAAERRIAKSTAPVAPPRPSGGPPPPPRVDVVITGVVFAAGKPDGTSWDLDGAGAAVVGTVGTVGAIGLGAGGVARVGQLGMVGLSAPDPVGWVQWLPADAADKGASNRRMALDARQDTWKPEWTGPRFRGIPLEPGTVFRVKVWDDDRGGDVDDVPAVDLGYEVLREALAAEGVTTVPAERPSGGALSAVLVRVRPSSLSNLSIEGAPAP